MTTPVEPRFYSSTALQTNLTSSINASATTIQVASTTGFPASTPFTLALDYGAANEELVDVTAVGGLSLTVTRAVDTTSASAHNAGAVVRHVTSARDFREMKEHELAETNVHGFTPADGEFVGTTATQSLSNKTLVRATGTLENVDIFNVGGWLTSVIGSSAAPNNSKFAVKKDEVGLVSQFEIRSNGAAFLFLETAEPDNNYKLRITNTALTDDRAYLLAGGTMKLFPTGTTTFPAVDIQAPDTSTSKRAIRLAAAGGGTERFTVWNDGRVDIVGTATNLGVLDVKGPASHATDYMRVLDSADNTLFSVQSTGKILANKGANITQPGVLSGTVLQVGGSNVGYVGDLQTWVSPANVIVGRVDEAGDASFNTVAAVNAETTVTTGTTNVSGWTVSAFEYRRSAAVHSIILEVERTGADVVPQSTKGNISPDLEICTIPASTRPHRSIYVAASSGIGHGSIRFQADGSVQLLTWIPSPSSNPADSNAVSITNGSTIRTTVQWID